MRGLKEKLRYQSFPFGIYGLLLVIILVFLGATQGNVSPAHLLNIARSAAPLGIAGSVHGRYHFHGQSGGCLGDERQQGKYAACRGDLPGFVPGGGIF